MEAVTILSGVEVSKVDYKEWRPNIKACDTLLWHGDTLVDKGIEWMGKPYDSTIGLSHGTLVFMPPIICDEYMVCGIEACGDGGLHPVQLSANLELEHGRCFHVSVNLTDDQRILGMKFAWKKVAKQLKYDWKGCWWNIIRRPIIGGNYYCTEFISDDYNQIGATHLKVAGMPNDMINIIKTFTPNITVVELILPKEEV